MCTIAPIIGEYTIQNSDFIRGLIALHIGGGITNFVGSGGGVTMTTIVSRF